MSINSDLRMAIAPSRHEKLVSMMLRVSTHRSRRGVAPLEFMLCLPILAVAFLVILWLGSNSSAQSDVAIEARNASWHERHTGSEGDALKLVKSSGSVTKPAEREVFVSHLFDSFAKPKSSHVVLAGSWDFHQLTEERMNMQPNWDLYQQVARESANLLGETFDENMFNGIQLESLNGFDPAQWAEGAFPGPMQDIGEWIGVGQTASDNQQQEYERVKAEEKSKQRKKVQDREDQIASDKARMSDDERSLADVDYEQWLLTRDGLSIDKVDDLNRLKDQKKELEERVDSKGEQKAHALFEQRKQLETEKRALAELDNL